MAAQLPSYFVLIYTFFSDGTKKKKCKNELEKKELRVKKEYLLTLPHNHCTFANSSDPDEIPQHAAFHQGLHYLRRLNRSSEKEILCFGNYKL